MTVSEAELLQQRRGGPPDERRLGDFVVELRGSELAEITYRGRSLLRAIRPVARDRDWNTATVEVDQVASDADGVRMELRFIDEGVDVGGLLSVTGSASELVVEFTAEARTPSWCNRLGLVVLHPPSSAGSAVTALHTDGSRQEGHWPVSVSPHQPFQDVAGFAWEQDGLAVGLQFDGDVFETEDQRNWTDASFKTYSTPLSRPFPVRHEPGSIVRQRVTLSVTPPTGSDPLVPRAATDADTVVVSEEIGGHVPALALGAALFPPPSVATGLRTAAYEAVLVELVGDTSPWSERMARAAEQAAALRCGLDVRVVTDDPDQLRSVAQQALEADVALVRLGAFDPTSHITTPALWEILQRLRSVLPDGTELVVGTRAHFTELNRRAAELPVDAAATTFSLTPQMHTTELDHIIDSLPMQHQVAADAQRLFPGRALHVGPITLARRFNAVATTGPRPPEVDAQHGIDPLQHTEFTAAWTLGSVAALSAVGVRSVCFYETAGPRGVSVDAEPDPTGQLLDQLAGLSGQRLQLVTTRKDLPALAVAQPDGTVRLHLADLSGHARTVRVRHGSEEVTVDLTAWERAALTL